MSNKKRKLLRKMEEEKIGAAIIVEKIHKQPCPVCDHENDCCSHCQHKILWGK